MIKNISPFKSAIVGVMALSVVACGGGSSSGPTRTDDVNTPPVANAGSAQTVEENIEVTLSGSASDSDGSVASFVWSQLSGPSVDISSASSAVTSFMAPEVVEDTVLSFRLTATDNDGATHSSEVDITVVNVNLLPVVAAGSNQSIDEHGEVTLTGSASDSDGSIVSYQWIQIAGPSVQLSDVTSASTSFIAPEVTSDTTLTFQLTATDNQDASSTSTVDVIVTNVNLIPTVEAGSNQTHQEGAQVELIGNGADTDGSIVSYQWQQTSGTDAVLQDVSSAAISFTLPDVPSDQMLTFTLTVTDNDGGTASDAVNINVLNRPKISELGFTDVGLTNCVNEVAQSQGIVYAEQLQELNCGNRNIRYLGGIENLQSLTYLDLSNNDLRYIGVVLQLAQLNRLNLQGNPYISCDLLQQIITLFGQDVVLAPSSCVPVGDLAMVDFSIDDANLQACVDEFAQSNGWLYTFEVTTLDCSNRKIANTVGISALHKLQTLNLSGNYLRTIDDIDYLSELQQLNLAQNFLGRVFKLSAMTWLTSLDLSGNDKALCDDLTQIESVVSNLTRPSECFQSELIADMEFEDPRLALCIETAREYLNLTHSSEVTALTCIPFDPDEEGVDGLVANAYSKAGGFLAQADDSVDYWDQIYSIAELKRFPYLQSMRFTANRIEDISVLAQLKHLDLVDLDYNQISNVTPIAQLKHLNKLQMRHNNLTDMQLSIGDEIVDMPHLEYLDLSNNGLTDTIDFAKINLPKLKTLKLAENSITDISDLAALSNLEELFIDDNNITDMSVVANMPQLNRFYVVNNQISSIAGVSQLNKLQYFVAGNNQIKSFTQLANLPQLKFIHLVDNQIDGSDDYSGLDFSHVTDLYLSNNKLTDLNFMNGSRWDSLILLGIRRNQINDISGLAGNNHIYFIYLDSNELTDVTALYDVTQLRVLGLTENDNIPCEQLSVFNDSSRFPYMEAFFGPDTCIE